MAQKWHSFFVRLNFISWMFQISDILLRFETRALQMRLESKIKAEVRIFTPPPVKFREGMGEMFDFTSSA